MASLLPLITIKEDDSQRYNVSFESIKFLRGLKDKKVSIVFLFEFEKLQNKLITQNLLKIKEMPQQTSKNKGISIWNQAFSLSPDHDLLVLESENLEQCDEKDLLNLFLAGSLLSSVSCINISGDLDEKTLQKLKFISHYNEKLTQEKYPNTRDFFILLHTASKELLSSQKNSLNDQFIQFLKEKEKDLDIIRSVKSSIVNCFSNKALFSFEKSPNASQINAFQENIQQKIKPKTFDGKNIKGPMVYKFAYETVEFLKKGHLINIPEILDQIFSSEAKEMLEDIKKDFLLKIKAELNEEESPYDEEEINKIFKLGNHDFSHLIDTKLKELTDMEKYIELKNDFIETYDKEYDTYIEANKMKSKEFCEEILSKFFSSLYIPEISSVENVRPTLIREFEDDFNRLLEIYMKNSRGPAKYQCLFENMSNFLFQKFQKFYENIVNVYIQENNKTRISLLQIKEERDKLQINLKDLEALRFEAEQLKENISRESESLKREFDYKLLSKDYNEESLRNALESKDKLIKKKKEQKKQLKAENSKFRENDLKHKHEINLILNEVSNLKKKNKELERILDESLFPLIRDLKGKITNVDEHLEKKASDQEKDISQIATTSLANVEDLEEELHHKQVEIEKLKKEKKELKEELSKKLDQETKRFNKLKEFLNSEIEMLKKEKEEMNKKMIIFDNRDQELKNLQTEIIKKDQNLEFLNHLLELNKQQIESIVCEIADIKQANGDLKQFKDSIPFILSEGLRFAMKQTKSNKIAVSLRTMKDEDAKLIIRVFEEAGLHLKL